MKYGVYPNVVCNTQSAKFEQIVIQIDMEKTLKQTFNKKDLFQVIVDSLDKE